MKLARAFRRKFGIAAPRMSVRTHVVWYWRWLFMVTAVAVGASLAWWMFDIGSQFAGFDRGEAYQAMTNLRDGVSRLQQENSVIKAEAATARRELQIEIATRHELTKSLKALQEDNAHLKEDLSFFHNLMSAEGKAGSVRIYRFKVERSAFPGEYRYRLLLLQSGTREHEFQGKAQFLANVLQNGQKTVLAISSEEPEKAQVVKLDFKYYQRVEGSFQVPPGAVVKSVDVKVFEKGVLQPRLSQTVNLS